jgi:hypothetical protein
MLSIFELFSYSSQSSIEVNFAPSFVLPRSIEVIAIVSNRDKADLRMPPHGMLLFTNMNMSLPRDQINQLPTKKHFTGYLLFHSLQISSPIIECQLKRTSQ